jgi:hypothetical protein
MSDESPKRRIISQATVVRTTSTSSSPAKMLEDALGIMDNQIERLRIKAAHTSLDEREARTLLGYVKGLVEISKEEREREKSGIAKELSELSTEELLKLAESKLKK